MRNLGVLTSTLCLAATFTALVPRAQADQWDKKTIVTFNQPVEISGTVLEPGTYVFKLVNLTDRNIVQISDADQTHVYATILAMPDYRVNLPWKSKPKFGYRETADGAPPAIKDWFAPSDQFGQEFLYQPLPVTQVATAQPAAPAAMPAAMPEEPKPVQAQPEQQAAMTPPAAPAPEEQPVETAQAAPPPAAPQDLPRTASPYPLVGMIGLLSLTAAGGLRLLSKRSA